MNITAILLYITLTHYYHSNDNINTAFNDLLYGKEETIQEELPSKEEIDHVVDVASTQEISIVDDSSDISEKEPEPKDDKVIAENSDIKDESELFDLNEEEFTIEDVSVKDIGDEVEITAVEKKAPQTEKIIPDKKSSDDNKADINISVIYKNIAGPTLGEARIILAFNMMKETLLAINPRKKSPLSYSNIINPPIINRRSYEPANQHLDPVQFHEEYFQMLFAAIDKQDMQALDIITQKTGLNDIAYAKGMTPLIYAISKGNINIIKKILSLGYDPNQKDEVGNAPIHIAILNNRVDIVTELIKYRANLTLPNSSYKRPMALAIETKNYYIADLLVKAGAVTIKKHKKFEKYINSEKNT